MNRFDVLEFSNAPAGKPSAHSARGTWPASAHGPPKSINMQKSCSSPTTIQLMRQEAGDLAGTTPTRQRPRLVRWWPYRQSLETGTITGSGTG